MSYLTEQQVRAILQTSHFSLPYTESFTRYSLYRGQINTAVLTLRFNLNEDSDDFEVSSIHSIVQQRLTYYFPTETHVLTSVDYDLLLTNTLLPAVPSYYIWKANSNRHQFDINRESVLPLIGTQIYQFAQNLYLRDLDQLNVFFADSNVTVVRALAVVCSFMPYSA